MTNPFINDKLTVRKVWRDLRISLTKDKDDLQHLISTVGFWSYAPLMSRVLDWDQPQTWPDPWELIHKGQYDESCVSLGMFYTLWYTEDMRWQNQRMKLILMKDEDRASQHIVLSIDDRYILNLDYQTIFDRKKSVLNAHVQEIYEFDGKVHMKQPYKFQKKLCDK